MAEPRPSTSDGQYRFRITRGHLGYGISNVSGGAPHLPRRSRLAAIAATERWADQQGAAEARTFDHAYRP